MYTCSSINKWNALYKKDCKYELHDDLCVVSFRQDASLTLAPARRYGLIGKNGAGIDLFTSHSDNTMRINGIHTYIHTYIHSFIRLKPSSFRKVDFDAIHRQLQATWVRSPEDSAGRSARGRRSGQATHLLMFAIMLYIVFTVCMYVCIYTVRIFFSLHDISILSKYVCMYVAY